MKKNQTELNRREFLSTAAVAAGVLALGITPSFAEGESLFEHQGRRVGISDRAYRNAWERARKLVAQLTVDEKISQLGSSARAVERLKVPHYNYYTGEALHGITQETPVTSFPVPLAMAAAWNPDLALQIYTAVSDEARAYDNTRKVGLSYYSPVTLNLHRDPRWSVAWKLPGRIPVSLPPSPCKWSAACRAITRTTSKARPARNILSATTPITTARPFLPIPTSAVSGNFTRVPIVRRFWKATSSVS